MNTDCLILTLSLLLQLSLTRSSALEPVVRICPPNDNLCHEYVTRAYQDIDNVLDSIPSIRKEPPAGEYNNEAHSHLSKAQKAVKLSNALKFLGEAEDSRRKRFYTHIRFGKREDETTTPDDDFYPQGRFGKRNSNVKIPHEYDLFEIGRITAHPTLSADSLPNDNKPPKSQLYTTNNMQDVRETRQEMGNSDGIRNAFYREYNNINTIPYPPDNLRQNIIQETAGIETSTLSNGYLPAYHGKRPIDNFYDMTDNQFKQATNDHHVLSADESSSDDYETSTIGVLDSSGKRFSPQGRFGKREEFEPQGRFGKRVPLDCCRGTKRFRPQGRFGKRAKFIPQTRFGKRDSSWCCKQYGLHKRFSPQGRFGKKEDSSSECCEPFVMINRFNQQSRSDETNGKRFHPQGGRFGKRMDGLLKESRLMNKLPDSQGRFAKRFNPQGRFGKKSQDFPPLSNTDIYGEMNPTDLIYSPNDIGYIDMAKLTDSRWPQNQLGIRSQRNENDPNSESFLLDNEANSFKTEIPGQRNFENYLRKCNYFYMKRFSPNCSILNDQISSSKSYSKVFRKRQYKHRQQESSELNGSLGNNVFYDRNNFEHDMSGL